MTNQIEGSRPSKFENIKRNNGHMNIVSEAFDQTFRGEIRTPEDVRDFVDDLEGDIQKKLDHLPTDVAERVARERAGSLVGQILGLNKDHNRSFFWLVSLEGTPQLDSVKIAYNTFASYRTR